MTEMPSDHDPTALENQKLRVETRKMLFETMAIALGMIVTIGGIAAALASWITALVLAQ